jgi:hypothetical protein
VDSLLKGGFDVKTHFSEAACMRRPLKNLILVVAHGLNRVSSASLTHMMVDDVTIGR